MLSLPQIWKAKPLHPDTISKMYMLERTLYSHRVFSFENWIVGFHLTPSTQSHLNRWMWWLDSRPGKGTVGSWSGLSQRSIANSPWQGLYSTVQNSSKHSTIKKTRGSLIPTHTQSSRWGPLLALKRNPFCESKLFLGRDDYSL